MAGLIEQGPPSSGVYARFAPSTGDLELLNPRARWCSDSIPTPDSSRRRPQGSDQPIWLVTGTDPAGVSAAAAAFTPSALDYHFALAVAGSSRLPLPLQPGR